MNKYPMLDYIQEKQIKIAENTEIEKALEVLESLRGFDLDGAGYRLAEHYGAVGVIEETTSYRHIRSNK
ncbi:MAG TPA: hypothetical protein DDZ76_12670 [Xanthomonadales bacterium]|nr:hypothetical protein [Xanthomonadales bacterium]